MEESLSSSNLSKEASIFDEMSTQTNETMLPPPQITESSLNGSMISLTNGNGGVCAMAQSNTDLTSLTNTLHSSPSTNGFKKAAEWVRLNIGGQYFVTTKTTLCKNAHSFFFKLLQDDPSVGLITDKVRIFNPLYILIFFLSSIF